MNNLRKDVLEPLESVLCDPEGKAGIRGSDADNRIIDEALDALRAALAEPQPVHECADNDSPWLVCKPCAADGKCKQAEPQPEPVALRAALMRLADAADRVGVEHFDSDSLPPAVDLLNTETRAVHTLLKQSAGPQPEPVAHIDLVQNPMRPSYFIAGAADEHPAEQVLRALACWLGVGGYNAQTVDAKVFHRKIVDGVEQLMKSRAAPQVQHPLTDEQINQCISADKAFWHTAAKETGWSFGPNLHDFARAIEAAHGIGVKNGPAGTSHVSSET